MKIQVNFIDYSSMQLIFVHQIDTENLGFNELLNEVILQVIRIEPLILILNFSQKLIPNCHFIHLIVLILYFRYFHVAWHKGKYIFMIKYL